MYDQWRCKRCETYNDERDEKCIVCGYEHSRQIDEITGPGWIDVPSVKKDDGASSEPKSFDAEVIAPDKKKLSGLKITLALTASIISAAVAASTNESDVGMVLAIMAIPFIAMWAWALKKK